MDAKGAGKASLDPEKLPAGLLCFAQLLESQGRLPVFPKGSTAPYTLVPAALVLKGHRQADNVLWCSRTIRLS